MVKQSFFGLPGQYGRRVTKANYKANKNDFKIVLADILFTNGDERNLILPKFARLYFFFSLISLFGTSKTEILLQENAQYFCI